MFIKAGFRLTISSVKIAAFWRVDNVFSKATVLRTSWYMPLYITIPVISISHLLVTIYGKYRSAVGVRKCRCPSHKASVLDYKDNEGSFSNNDSLHSPLINAKEDTLNLRLVEYDLQVSIHTDLYVFPSPSPFYSLHFVEVHTRAGPPSEILNPSDMSWDLSASLTF